jgi:hypothetical protein
MLGAMEAFSGITTCSSSSSSSSKRYICVLQYTRCCQAQALAACCVHAAANLHSSASHGATVAGSCFVSLLLQLPGQDHKQQPPRSLSTSC